MLFLLNEFAWKIQKSKSSRTSLSLNKYIIFKSLSDLQISINNLSRASVKLLHHSAQFRRPQLFSYI